MFTANYSKESAEVFHDVSGWVMLVVGYLLLMGLVQLLQWITAASPRYNAVRVPATWKKGANNDVCTN